MELVLDLPENPELKNLDVKAILLPNFTKTDYSQWVNRLRLWVGVRSSSKKI